IAVKKVGDKTFPIVARHVGRSRLATVDDGETVAAMARLAHYEHLLTEGAGAVAVAAICEGRFKFHPNEHVVLVVSGGNISWNDFRAATRSLAPWVGYRRRWCQRSL